MPSQVNYSKTEQPMKHPSITVVLPAYNERSNVDVLIDELFKNDSQKCIKRVIYVDDDSPDGTSEYIKSKSFPLEVLCLHRIGRQGLSSAVTEGILLADTDFVAVMDADGQHAPRDLMLMIDKLKGTQADLIIGSRFKDKRDPVSHVGLRLLISRIGNRFSNLLIKKVLSDPLTGFFIVNRKQFIEIAKIIRPTGFKILLEILYALRNKKVSVEEVQIEFRHRHAGESKLDSLVIIEFIEQIVNRATNGIVPEKFISFSLVGGTGIIIHMTCLYLMMLRYPSNFLVSQAIATGVAMLWNYMLNNALTFRRNRKHGLQHIKGLSLFILSCSLGAFANVGVANAINNHHVTWWLSGLAGIVVGTVFNFVISKTMVWN